MSDDYISLGEGEVTRETDDALQFRLVDYGDEFWIPKSVVQLMHGIRPSIGVWSEVFVKRWWAKKEGWTDAD